MQSVVTLEQVAADRRGRPALGSWRSARRAGAVLLTKPHPSGTPIAASRSIIPSTRIHDNAHRGVASSPSSGTAYSDRCGRYYEFSTLSDDASEPRVAHRIVVSNGGQAWSAGARVQHRDRRGVHTFQAAVRAAGGGLSWQCDTRAPEGGWSTSRQSRIVPDASPTPISAECAIPLGGCRPRVLRGLPPPTHRR